MHWFNILIYLLNSLIVLFIGPVFCLEEDLCHLRSCHIESFLPSENILLEFCEKNHFTQHGRCCVDSNDTLSTSPTIAGLDLSGCHLHTTSVLEHVNITVTNNITYNRGELQVLLLEGNPLETCNADSFTGMTGLEWLSLPGNCTCPGGDFAWNNETHLSENVTVCMDLTNLCVEHNISCPSNSHCTMHAPGDTWCVCDEGYHGYKCLKYGEFPAIAYSIGITLATVLLILAFRASRRLASARPE